MRPFVPPSPLWLSIPIGMNTSLLRQYEIPRKKKKTWNNLFLIKNFISPLFLSSLSLFIKLCKIVIFAILIDGFVAIAIYLSIFAVRRIIFWVLSLIKFSLDLFHTYKLYSARCTGKYWESSDGNYLASTSPWEYPLGISSARGTGIWSAPCRAKGMYAFSNL